MQNQDVPLSVEPSSLSRPDRIRPLVIYGLGTLLMALNAWFGTYAYVVAQALLWTQTSLQRGPVVLLFTLVVLNLFLSRFLRRLAFSRAELLILYAMLCLGTCAAGYGFVQILINHLAAPFYFASGGNKFTDYLQPHIPEWLAPRTPEILDDFYRGNSTLYTPVHLGGWLVPVLAWSGFMVAIFGTLLCLTTLFRRQWVEEERLTFPLVLLPLQLTEGGTGGAFWKNKGMWLGFLLAGLLESLNFMNWLNPAVPQLPIKPGMGQNEIGALFTSRPLNATGRLSLAFYPFAIGIGYLLSLDVSFSAWFLYLASKVLLVLCAALGLTDGPSGSPSARMPYIREQGFGAFLGIAFFSLWMARNALKEAWTEFERPTGRDKNELMPFRWAITGVAAGLLIQFGFLTAIGLSPFQAGLFVVVYTALALTLARIVSEVGAGWAWAPFWSPGAFVAESIGINHLSPKQITGLFAYTAWMNDMRDNPFPQTMQHMKLAGVVRERTIADVSPRRFLAPLLFAIVCGAVLAFWAHLDIYYTHGAATAKVRPALANSATGPGRQAVTYMITPTLQDISGLFAAGFGGVVAVGMSLLRQRIPGWTLHPLGYALAMTNSMEYMWCPFFLAWTAKAITLRYGGIRAYRAALPFFLGLILGDYVIPTLWGIFGAITDTQQYMAFPH